MSKRRLFWTLGYLLIAGWASADRTSYPAEATVFVRVVGTVEVVHEGRWKNGVGDRYEIAVGSGFVISPLGHVLTNYHLIAGQEVMVFVDGEWLEISMEVDTVEVAFPAEFGLESMGSIGPDELRRFFPVTVEATDPELDLALLRMSGADLPYIPLGDSDAVDPGQEIRILGYPLGWRANVGRKAYRKAVPQVSINQGALSAVRYDDENRPRYLQTDANTNRGNSGGPLVDRDGYALGVVSLRWIDDSSAGFSIPINRVKVFLEESGFNWIFPAARYELGFMEVLQGKGLRLHVPVGFSDDAPSRTRVRGGEPEHGVVLLIDRVASSWSLDQLEKRYLSGELWKHGSFFEPGRRRALRKGKARFLFGHASGVGEVHKESVKVEYALVDLGKEKILARYVGPAQDVAFNLGVLRASLESLAVEPMMTARSDRVTEVSWEQAPPPYGLGPDGLFPSGWVQQETGTPSCSGLPPADSSVTASPEEDFTVALRLSWWASPGIAARNAAFNCSEYQGRFGAASYLHAVSWLGIRYAVEGHFIPLGKGLVQLEVVTPLDQRAYGYHLFEEWMSRLQDTLRSSQAVKSPG